MKIMVFCQPRILARMSAIERGKLLQAAAELAAEEYQNDSELVDFEAFGEEDLYDTQSE